MQCGKRSAEGHVLAEAPLGRHLVGRQIGEGEGKERLLRQPLLCLEDDRGRESVFSQRGSGTLMVEAAAVTAGEAAVAPTKAVGKVVAMCVVVGIVGIGGDVVIVIVVVLVVVVDLFEVCVGGESWFGLRRRAFVSSGAVEQSGVGLPGELFAEASQFFYFYIHSVTVSSCRRRGRGKRSDFERLILCRGRGRCGRRRGCSGSDRDPGSSTPNAGGRADTRGLRAVHCVGVKACECVCEGG